MSARSPSDAVVYDRARRTKPVATWVGATVALALHGALIVILQAVDPAAVFGSRPQPSFTAGLATGCVSDVALATSARMALCLAPWHSELAACLTDAQLSAWVDLASCQTDRDRQFAEVAVLDATTAERVRALDPTQLLAAVPERNQPQPKPPDAAPLPPPPTRASQVVETAKPIEQEVPDNARFLAEYDTRVEKQTVARGTVREPMIANPKPSALAPKPVPRETSASDPGKSPTRDDPGKSLTRESPTAGRLAMRNPAGLAGPAPVARESGRLGANGSPAADGDSAPKGQGAMSQSKRDRAELAPGMGGPSGAPDVANLKPTADVLERAIGGGSIDHLDDVATGDVTALSAKRWVYASFFNRLKRQVAQNWDPASVWRRSDPNGQVHGQKTRVTEVRVSLSTSGQVAKIVVVTPSGVGDLDDEALRAFRAAGPFPNPPRDLAGPDQLITFAFAFYFEIGASRTSWRVIRSM